MSEQEQIYHPATKELAEQRKNLAPKTAKVLQGVQSERICRWGTPRED